MRAILLAKRNAKAKEQGEINTADSHRQNLLDDQFGKSNLKKKTFLSKYRSVKDGDRSVSFAPYKPPSVGGTDALSTELSPLTNNVAPTKQIIREGYNWDLCIVVLNPIHQDNQELIRHRTVNQESYEAIMERLYLAGLQTYPYLSKDHTEIFIKVRASLERLEEHAALIELPMLLDPAYLKDHIDNPKSLVRDDPTQTNLTPYQFIHAKYQQGTKHILTNVHHRHSLCLSPSLYY